MKNIFTILLLLIYTSLYAQDAIEYQTPPKAIYDLVTARISPSASFDHKGEWMLIMERSTMPPVEELAQPELRIAGLRINPNNFGLSRTPFITNITLKDVKTGHEYPIAGLPQPLKAGNISWNTDETKVAFTQTGTHAIDLFTIDVKQHKAVKINKQALNMVIGSAYEWIDNTSLLYKTIVKPYTMAPQKPLAPRGPVVQQNLGKTAASVTYQDLIKSPNDEAQFEFYATAQLTRNTNGIETKLGNPAIFKTTDVSPDKKYLLLEQIDKPYSYLVTANGFNNTVYITYIVR